MDRLAIESFSKAAPTYDANAKPQHELWSKLLELLGSLDFKSNNKILDIGMGTGRNVHELSNLLPNSYILGFDLAWGMVKYANNNWRVDKNRPVFLQADLRTMPFKSASFDLIVSNAVFQRAGDLKVAFSEVNRILKPKGIFCLSLFTHDTLLELKGAFIRAYRTVKGLQQQIPDAYELPKSDKVLKAIEDCSFSIMETADFRKKQYFKDATDIIRWCKAIGANRNFENWIDGINAGAVLREVDRIYKERQDVFASFEALIVKVQKK